MIDKLFLLLSLLGICLGCVSRGSNVKKMGDDVFEARAWDGYGCLKTSDNNTCFTLLMPIIKSKADEKCDGEVDSITPCMRYEAVTADRIVCKFRCKPEEDEEESDEEVDPRKRTKSRD